MDHKDVKFQRLHNIMNNLLKKLLSEGIGAQKKHARVITELEENEMWLKGVMGTNTLLVLQNAIFFYCGMLFCFVTVSPVSLKNLQGCIILLN